MKKITLIIAVMLLFSCSSKENKDIEIQYFNGQKFYVLKSAGHNVAFMKAN